MTRIRRAAVRALLPLSLITAAMLAACSAGANPAAGHPNPGTAAARPAPSSNVLTGRLGAATVPARFVALSNWPAHPGIAAYESQTGAMVRRILPASRDGMTVTGLSIDRSGNLWITYSRGPHLKAPGVMGGDPQPDTCANEIAVLHPTTGRVSVFLRSGANVLISDAAISPDGRLVAYLESGCATGYFNSHLAVMDAASGQSWTIGGQIPRCHFITGPEWTSDDRDLVVAYSPAASARYRGPQGSCLAPRRAELVEVSATASQPELTGTTAAAQEHCQITASASLSNGQVLAIEACGAQGYLAGPARLLVYDRQLRLVHDFQLGQCTDGNDLSTDVSGSAALVSAYLYCNPPGTRQPVSRLWSYSGGVLRPIARVPQGTLAWLYMTW
jgi:hypothetical protein